MDNLNKEQLLAMATFCYSKNPPDHIGKLAEETIIYYIISEDLADMDDEEKIRQVFSEIVTNSTLESLVNQDLVEAEFDETKVTFKIKVD